MRVARTAAFEWVWITAPAPRREGRGGEEREEEGEGRKKGRGRWKKVVERRRIKGWMGEGNQGSRRERVGREAGRQGREVG